MKNNCDIRERNEKIGNIATSQFSFNFLNFLNENDHANFIELINSDVYNVNSQLM